MMIIFRPSESTQTGIDHIFTNQKQYSTSEGVPLVCQMSALQHLLCQ
jgi:hypothetical protein